MATDGRIPALFRVLFGLLLVAIPARLVAYDWVDALYTGPSFHFVWLPDLPVLHETAFTALLAGLALAGLAVAVGWRSRLAAALYLVGFLYVEAVDATLYLNHYVLVTLLLVGVVAHPRLRSDEAVTPLTLWFFRGLLASVYVHAGLCKLNPDWLLRAEPLHTWLLARQDLPVFGGLLAHTATAFAMSWGGAAYDLGIAALLLWPRTRLVGFGLVVFFHLVTWALFPIGVFPWVMLAGSLWFLPIEARTSTAPSSTRTVLTGLFLAFVFLVPLRHLALGGDVNWHEQGYRFSWRVLLNEKTGLVDYRVVRPDGTVRRVRPSAELTPVQHEQMRVQPDLIVQYARHLAEVHDAHEVYADSWVSWNGRPSTPYVRSDVNLLTVGWSTPWSDWIHPAPR